MLEANLSTVKNCAQVFVFLHKLYFVPMDCADGSCSQLPVLAGKGHNHLCGLLHGLTPGPIY